MKKSPMVIVAAIPLAGCMQPAEIASEPVKAAFVREVPAERLAANTTAITVRTFLPGENKNVIGAEVTGVKCALESDDLRATVVTPQQVIVPSYKQRAEFPNRGVPGSIVVRCKSPNASGSSIVVASEKKAATAVGAGLGVAILTTLVTASVASSTPWKYSPNVIVILKE